MEIYSRAGGVSNLCTAPKRDLLMHPVTTGLKFKQVSRIEPALLARSLFL
jgi:hypothetical protein